MANPVELANAYIALTVRAPHIKRDLESTISRADVDGVGKKLGERTSKGFSTGMAALAGAVGGVFSQIAGRAMSSLGDVWSEASAMSDGLQKFKSTLEFAGLDTKNIDRLSKATRKYADQTVYDLTDIQNITAQLASNGVKDYDKLAEASGNLNAIAGGNAETFKSVGQVLSQTAGVGKLTAENWGQLSDAIPGASGKIQEALQKNGAFVGNFRDAMSKGEITAQEFNTALLQLGNEPVAVEAAKSTETLEGAFGNLKANIVGAMSDLLTNIKPQLTDIITGVANAFQGATQGVKSAISWVQDNLTWIGPAVAGIGGIAASFAAMNAAATIAAAGGLAKWIASTNIATAATKAFNFVVGMSPLAKIVTLISAVVGALTYFFTQTELGKEIWANFTRFLGEAWNNIVKVATWAWENVLKPILEGIGAVVTWVYESIIRPIFTGIVNYFRIWGAVATWLWKNAISPVVNGIGAGFSWLFKDVIQPVWSGIQTAISSAWNWINKNVFSPMKTGIDAVGKAFDAVGKFIGEVWTRVQDAAKSPVKFLINTVWNNGIRSFAVDVLKALGLNDLAKGLPRVRLPFANGGVLPGYTPGRDVHEFYSPTGGRLALSGGEAIMRPEFTRLVGGKAGVDALNAAARGGRLGFKNGGVLGELGNFAGDVWDNIADAASTAWDFISDPAGAVRKHMSGFIKGLGGNGVFSDLVAGVPKMLLRGFEQMFGSVNPPSRGSSGMGWRAMQSIVLQNIPGARISSAYRSAAGNASVGGAKGSYHMQGRAIDIVPPSMAMFNSVKRLFPNAAELIYTPAGAAQLRNGKAFAGWSSKVKAQHFNHIHLAMANGGVVPQLFDQGGWLPHGGVAVNKSGKPEPVLTNDQWKLMANGGLRSGDRVVIEIEGTPLTGTVRRVVDEAFSPVSAMAMAVEFAH